MSEYQPIGKQCQYCGLTMARDIEKYLGKIPYKINSDDKYLDGVEQVKNTILQTTPDPITKTPKCTPFNKKSVPEGYLIQYVYFNPIPEKYDTGEPGFAIINPKKNKKLKCNPTIMKGGRKTRKKRGGMFSPFAKYAMSHSENQMRDKMEQGRRREYELSTNRCSHPVHIKDISTQFPQKTPIFVAILPSHCEKPEPRRKSIKKKKGGRRKTKHKKRKRKRRRKRTKKKR
tara:strand:- start:523 stop:1212 length:690 start_codon:yes stop_codon:yes gene_type:complete